MGGKKKCYKCDKEATGQEHIPPKCIFPERKDLDGDYRKNLITVLKAPPKTVAIINVV